MVIRDLAPSGAFYPDYTRNGRSHMAETKFKSGNQAGKVGRPKGTPNKTPAAIKDMILTALSDAGGAEYLLKRANDPRTAAAFLGLVGKVLPMQVTGEGGGAIRLETIKRVIVDPRGTTT